ncbi:MAG: AbrB/MazE/SpoVT family DNA-binding domain-containing protein [Acidobacteriota bacterium]|nr:AbrB/MazE/SpoVT family DNA-binding domain-containing protein [Acidobacteriota bacterium]
MVESAVTSKGQTTLPKSVRQALGVRTGGRVRYVILDNEVRILPVRSIGRLFAALRHDGPHRTPEDMEQAVAEGACE